MESSNPLQLHNPIIPEPEQVLDPFFEPILPDATEPVGLDSPSLLPEQLPVPIAPSAGSDLFHRHIQGQISSHLSPPPEPLPPLAAEPPDAIVGGSFAVNQEAVASFGGTGTGLNAEYFDNADFTNPVFTDIDPTIDFNFGKGSPDPSIGSDTFSVRWTGKVQPLFTESYSFHTRSDDGTRLWVNGELLIDNWRDQRVKERSGDIFLEAGQLYDITLEYYEYKGKAVSQLLWSSPSQPQEIIPASQLYPLPTSAIDEPQDLLFITDAFYNPTDAIAVMGKVYHADGVRDLARIDFSLQKDGGERIDVSDAVDFTTDSNDYGYAFFSHNFGQLSPGHYQLQGTAYDLAGGASNTETTSFTVLSLPPGDELSQRVQWAIDRAQELDNYDPDALTATSEWVVSVQGGQSSSTLADSFGAVDLGATGYIPNTYVWQFPSETNPFEVASQLASNFQVEFAYPLVTVPVIFHDPIDEPFVANGRQWHLRSGVDLNADANISNVWAQDVLGRNVTIGVVDNGFETDDFAKGLTGHPDLSPNYRSDLSYDFDEGDRFPSRLLNATQHWRARWKHEKEIENDRTNRFFLNSPSSGGFVNELDINFNISHEYVSDLSVVLVSPNGTNVELIGVGNGRNYADLTEIFKGESADGTWKLEIKDDDRDDDDDHRHRGRHRGRHRDDNDDREGRLNSWSLDFEVINFHGTSVAGVAAASGNNRIGGSGVAPEANWAGLRMGADGTNSLETANALSHKNGAIDIYNNSWGLGFFQVLPDPEFRFWKLRDPEKVVEDSANDGRGGLGNIYVFSGGNGQEDEFGNRHGNVNYNSLANSRHTIAVAAIDHQGKQALYSEPGAPLLVSAYSSSGLEGDRGITTTSLYSNDGNNRNDYTHEFGGTSASAPFVSGVTALILEANPSLTWRDTQHILVETAQKNDPRDSDWRENGAGYHVNHKYGFGAIDAEAAVDLARNWTPVGEEIFVEKSRFVGRRIPNYKPKNPKSLTSTITINPEDDMIAEWVEVEFDGTHRYLGDLEIVLISPDGTESVLAEHHRHGKYAWDDDSYHWTFTSARNWGESAVGEWTLQVSDKDKRNPSLWNSWNFWNSWKLRVFGTEPTTPPTVTVTATDANASESGDPGAFTVTRTGNTDNQLRVSYLTAGEAIPGTDYQAIGSIIIPAGQSFVTVPITPLDDSLVESDETVVVNVVADPGYQLGDAISATAVIADNDLAENPPAEDPPAENPPAEDPPGEDPPAEDPPDAPTNNPPTLTTISPLNGAIELTAFTITHSDLLAASDAADGDGDAISFQIVSRESGTLTENDVPVEPGTTTLSENEELLWISDAVGESVPAFTVLAFDGKDASSTPVPVNITVAAIETIEIPSEPWVRQIESPGRDYANDLVTDRFGNVYMTGRTKGSLGDTNAGSNDIFVTKYDREGNLLWTRQLGTPGGDASNGITVDSEGNVYIAGGTQGTLGEEHAGQVDAFAIAYDRDGNLKWTQQLGTADYDSANDITIDSSGNVYILGVTDGSLEGTNAGSNDVFVTKYNSDGDPLWTRQSGTEGNDYANDIAIDNQGNVYMTGYTTGSYSGNNAGSNDAFTIKYDSDGNLLWQRQLGTSAFDLANAIATDATGVYITGSTAGDLSGTNAGSFDAFVAKYNFQGNLLWQQQLGTDRSDISNGIITDDGGNLYITGTTYGDLGGDNAGGSDAFLAKYDSQGTLLETQQLGTPGNDDSNGISIDRTGNVYIGGTTTGSLAGNNQGSEDAWVGKNYTQPSVTITVAPGNASEDDGNAVVFTIARTEDLSEPLNVSYSTDGNATVADDYLLLDSQGNSLDGSVTIPAGESSVTLTLQPIDDTEFEGEETVVVNVTAGIGYQLGGDRTAEVSIADNDLPDEPEPELE